MPIGNGNYSWKVLEDPLEVGGFEKNTKFSEEAIINMLKYHSFTMGTTLFHRQYGKFEVVPPSRIDAPCRMLNSKWIVVVNGWKLVKLERGRRVAV